MKYLYLLFLILPGAARSQFFNTGIFNQLSDVNSYWLSMPVKNQVLPGSTLAVTENEIVKQHLQQVEIQLRLSNTSHLSVQQKKNRNFCLNQLHEYWMKEAFPKNTDFLLRTPYFIDRFSNYCAVGYLLKQSGFDSVAREIHRQHNNDYLKELTHYYPEIGQWANCFGFTLNELAWIQPTYGQSFYFADINTITYDSTFKIHPATCLTLNDGGVSLPFHPYPYTSVKVLTFFGNVLPLGFNMPTTNLTSGMSTGWYAIIAIDSQNDTTLFSNVLIPFTDTPTVDINVTHELCDQPCSGSISLYNVVDAVPPIMYSLHLGNSSGLQSTGMFNNVCAGNYYWAGIIDSRGCYGELSFNTMPFVHGQMSTNHTITTPIPCVGGQGAVQITASGGTPPYANTGIHWLTSGTHSILVTDSSSCTDTVSFTLVDPPPLSISVSSSPDYGFGNGSVSAITTGGIPPYNYLWNTMDTTWTVNNLVAGNYTINVTDSYGCSISSQVLVLLNTPTGMEITPSGKHNIYPNPANTYVNIEGELDELQSICIIDMLGRKMDVDITWHHKTCVLRTASFSEGTYFVIIQNTNNSTQMSKLVIDKTID